MKLIIAGCRHINYPFIVQRAIDFFGISGITEVVDGGAEGVDRLGAFWAQDNKIKICMFPADWKKHGKAAGPIRNEQMAKYADGLLAIWDRKSRGTRNMIENAIKYKLDVWIYYL